MNAANAAALLICVLSGWLIMNALAPADGVAGRWVARIRQLALGAWIGPGIASLLLFPLVLAGAATAAFVWPLLALLLAGSAVFKLRTPRVLLPKPLGEVRYWSENERALQRLMLSALAIGLGISVALVGQQFRQRPTGNWDAMGFWNLRAAYMTVDGGNWQRVLRHNADGYPTEEVHPAYPLFLSGVVALQWSAGENMDPMAPRATAILFGAALVALLGASLADGKSAILGSLGCLVLLEASAFGRLVSFQGADLPLALGILAAIVLLHQAERTGEQRAFLAAGLAAGLTIWMKNEGWPFLLAFAGMAVWRFGRQAGKWVLTGAAPSLLITLSMKALASGVEWFIPRSAGGVLSRVVNPARWLEIVNGFAHGAASLGPLWAHPVVLLALLAAVFRFVPAEQRRTYYWLAVPLGALFLADYGVYVITQFSLEWHLRTSVQRVVMQLWPALLWLAISVMRAPDERVSPAES